MKKLAVITTHPIQYNAPLFRLLTERGKIDVKVFYTWSQSKQGAVYDPNFGLSFKWDIPLLDGYEYEFVENESKDPGSHHYNGIVNRNLIPCIDKFQPDAILVYGWSFKSHLKVIRYYKGKIPVLFRGDSTLLDETPGFSVRTLARRIFLRWVYSYIDFALFVGSANKAYFIKHGLKSAQLVYAPHAIDNRRFAEQGNLEVAARIRTKLNIKPSDTVLLFAGKLEPKKNPDLLLEIFKELREDNIHLVFAGNGELEQQMKNSSLENDHIHFIGFQNQQEMPSTYKLADVLVLPSAGPGETWGLAINEAMAVGLPVIASDACGGAGDLINSTKLGRIVRRNNREDLKVTIQSLLAVGKEELAQMGNAAKEHIKNFSFERIAEAIEGTVNK